MNEINKMKAHMRISGNKPSPMFWEYNSNYGTKKYLVWNDSSVSLGRRNCLGIVNFIHMHIYLDIYQDGLYIQGFGFSEEILLWSDLYDN